MPRPQLQLRSEGKLRLFGRELPDAPPVDHRPDWQQAEVPWIRKALQHSQKLPTGGWYAVDATREITGSPRCVWVKGRPLVVWRDGDQLFAAPEACPHMGASLAGARKCDGRLVCPWHGLQLGPEGHGGWKHLPTHDDGILMWVQIPSSDQASADPPTDAPILPARPDHPIDAVVRVEAACEPRDVIQNRLDPWHGAHFHPHSFGRLHVIDQQDDEITVRVAYRVLGPMAVEVDARFHCPDARTIVMTIVRGEGQGSVVETHATPTRPGRTAIIEATLASSARPGFEYARKATPLLRPLMKWAATRLWHEDAEYAERLYTLRTR
ncbi:MAG: DUF5914 domain-containing protein [Myxococcales bacterium]|jgi:isorenieratene synthase